MTYYNANVYVASPTEFAHDDCLPEDQFTYHTMRDGYVHKHQIAPWNWAPFYGRPEPCKYCGKPVK